MLLDEIVKILAMESINIECKSRLNRDETEGWLKTIALMEQLTKKSLQ